MTKILHILTDSNIGGAGHQMLALLNKENGLNRTEFDITVALPQGAKLLPALQAQDIHCIELPYLAEKSFSRKAVSVLLAEMKRIKPHIVHTHAALSGRIAAKIYGKCKIVYTRHSVFDPTPRQKKFPMRNVIGFVNNFFSHAIIAVSPAAVDNLIQLGTNPKKITTIFNGMPKARALDRNTLRQKYDIPHDAFVLLQLARLTEVKGQNDVLTAAKLLPGALFLIAGDGELRPHLEKRIKSEGITNVRLLGFITEVEELLAIMDVQLSASFGTEATSLSLVQGMSVGKPAVVTDYGGNPYVIQDGENGLIVPTHNPAALAQAIEKLQTFPELQKNMATKAREIYALKFTVEKMVSETTILYRKVLVKL